MASTAPIMESIASLEKELARLKAALAESGVALPAKAKKAKKERDPDAPPPKANPFFDFLNGRIRPLLKENASRLLEAETKLPGTVAPLFASHLKETVENSYEMEDEAILEAFKVWATPETLAAAKPARKEKDAASESGSVAEPKADKPKRVLSEEQKAAMKAGREKAKAAKEAAKAEAAPKEEAPAAAKPVAKFGKKEVKKEKTYTLAELQDWDELEIDGETYGVNKRGDVINGEGEFKGRWNGKALDREAAEPADWAQVMA